MFSGLNRIQIIGNLGRDPEMRFTPSGKPVTNFSVAVNRRRQTPEGEWTDETEWFGVACWNRLAETIDNMASRGHLTKGTKVYVEGRLQTRRYTDRDGQERTAIDIVANQVLILSSRGEGGERDPMGGRSRDSFSTGGDDDFDDVPF